MKLDKFVHWSTKWSTNLCQSQINCQFYKMNIFLKTSLNFKLSRISIFRETFYGSSSFTKCWKIYYISMLVYDLKTVIFPVVCLPWRLCFSELNLPCPLSLIIKNWRLTDRIKNYTKHFSGWLQLNEQLFSIVVNVWGNLIGDNKKYLYNNNNNNEFFVNLVSPSLLSP